MCLLFSVALLWLASVAVAGEGVLIEFSIPAQRADRALTAFARQAGLSVLFPYDEVSRISANPLNGSFALEQGLEQLLAGTGLRAGIQDGTRLTVSLAGTGAAQPADHKAPGLLAQLLHALGSVLKADTAQPKDLGEDRAAAELEEVIVTGSRIRRDGFSGAQPATVLDGDMLAVFGSSNVGDAMALVPSNLGNWTPTAKPGGNESVPLNVFNGLNLANLRGLNPVYGSRTLTLVDSRRHTPTNQGDGVDLNMIPLILIDRMEIVTGGASASYGSGAIGGVVNVLLKHDLDGLNTEFGFGTTEHGDGNDRYYGVAWGGGVGETGRLVLALETQNMDPIEHCIDIRSWCARGASVRENRDYANNGQPNFVYRENVRSDMSTRGVLYRQARVFDATGSRHVPYAPAGPLQVGGDGQPIYKDTTLRTNVDRRVAYAGYEQRLGEASYLFLESSFGRVSSWTPQDGIDLFGAYLKPDNYYLQRLASNPCQDTPATCFISKDFSAQVSAVNDTRTDMRRFTLGFGGRIGESSWTWDAYYQHGRADMLQAVHNSRHALRMQFALDAVDDGNGQAVCRVVRDGIAARFNGDPRLAQGCVPLNVFGTGNLDPEAVAYSWGRIREDTGVAQDMAELVASGDIGVDVGAGPLRAALGLSWRDEALANVADTRQPDYIRTDYNSQFGETFGGDVAVVEYFAELEIPVTERLGVQLAARRSQYENTAGVGTPVAGRKFRYDIDTWKAAGNWQLNDWLTLRASQSRDLRAPNFRELYYGKVFPKGSNFGYCENPWTNNLFEGWYTFTGDSCQAELRGGIDLKPEKSDTSTLGLVFNPPGRGTRVAVDYYRIRIEDAITPASWFYTIDQCYQARDPEFCALIDGELINPNDPLGGFSRLDVVSSKSLNQHYYETRGIDIVADWAYPYAGGTLSMRLMASRMIEQLVQIGTTPGELLDIAGMTGSRGGGYDWEAAPDWSAQWFTTFARGPLSVTLQSRYVSEGIKDATRTGPGQMGFDPSAADSIDDNHVPSYLVWGLSSSFDVELLGMRAQLFGSIQNLFDRDPPLIGTGLAGTNPVLFDTIGRRYRVGLRAQF